MPFDERRRALVEFKRAISWVVVAGVLMVIGATIYLAITGDLTAHMIIATIIGAFLSVLLGRRADGGQLLQRQERPRPEHQRRH